MGRGPSGQLKHEAEWEHYDILTRVVRAWDDLLGQPRVALQRLEKDFLETLRDRWATNLRGIQVNLLIKLARYDEAQQICEKLIHDYPLCWMPRETLLKWLAETGEREASNTLKTDGRRVGLFSKAKVLQASGRFEESAAICRQLLDDMPTSAAGGWLLLKRETTERLKRLEARVQP
jgi:tetratricopeptide (TPR) repeat protein